MAVGDPSASDVLAERKRLYARMDREAKQLSPQALAVYLASKGRHNKRQKMCDLYLTNGRNLGMTMELFSSTEQVDEQGSKQERKPMTFKDVENKFGAAGAQELAQRLEREGSYEVQPLLPDNKDLWLYSVFAGTTKTVGSKAGAEQDVGQ